MTASALKRTLQVALQGFHRDISWRRDCKLVVGQNSVVLPRHYHLFNHFTLHSSSRHKFLLTADINWEMLASQRATCGKFICSSAPRTAPIKADNVIIKRADRQELSARLFDLHTSAICYTSQMTKLPPFKYNTWNIKCNN